MKSQNQANLEYLKELIGDCKFEAVMIALAGQKIHFPQSQYYDKEQRNSDIKEDYYAGMEIDGLAEKYELSTSQVYKIVEGRY